MAYRNAASWLLMSLAPRPRNSTTDKAKRGADAKGKGNQRPDGPASETLAGLGTTKQEIGGEGAEASAALGTSRRERSGVPHSSSQQELDSCFVVKDANGQPLAYMYFEKEPRRGFRRELLTLRVIIGLCLSATSRRPGQSRWSRPCHHAIFQFEYKLLCC